MGAYYSLKNRKTVINELKLLFEDLNDIHRFKMIIIELILLNSQIFLIDTGPHNKGSGS